AVGRARVVEILVAHPHLGEVVNLERGRRVDPPALEPAELPERVAFLVHRIEANGDVLADGLPRIQRVTPGVIRPGLRGRFVDPLAVGLLQGSVEDAAAGAAPEGDRTRSFQDFHALRVVEITKILDVIAEAVDEKVRARVHAADDELVAVAFTLVHVDAGHVTRDVGEILKAVVRDELPRHDAERLRNVDDRRIDFGRHRVAVRVHADRAGARILRAAGRPRRLDRGARIGRAWRRRNWPRRAHLRRSYWRCGARLALRCLNGDRRQRSRVWLRWRRRSPQAMRMGPMAGKEAPAPARPAPMETRLWARLVPAAIPGRGLGLHPRPRVPDSSPKTALS